jgi:hypothetical protein
MALLLGLGFLLILAIPLAVSMHRANELFLVEVRQGQVRLVRGHAPPRLLHDLGDVVTRPRVGSARIRVVTEDGAPRVLAEGDLTDAHRQQLRNVVGTWPVAKIRAGRRA